MKMPKRSVFPVELPPDILGLPMPTIIGLACETEEQTRARAERVRAGVIAAFDAAALHLGEDRARALFKEVVRRTKRGLGSHFETDRDARLLAAADAAERERKSLAALSRELFATGLKLGASPQAIETQIRKLRRERTKRDKARAIEGRRWRMATRNEPPTIVASALSEK